MHRLVLIFTLLFTFPLWACARAVAPWNAGLNFEQTEWHLAGDDVRKVETLAGYLASRGKRYTGTAEAYVLTLTSGLVGLAKFSDNPKPLRAAHGAYRASRIFGFRLVPPTVMREFKQFGKRTGVFQLFVDTPYDLLQKNQRAKAYHAVSAKDRSDLIALKFILGRWDNHPGNELIDASGTPALIDSDEILDLQQVKYGEYAYIRYGDVFGIPVGDSRIRLLGDDFTPEESFNFESPHVFRSMQFRDLQWRFSTYLDMAALKKLHSELIRRQFVKNTIRSVDWGGHVWIQWNTVDNEPLYTKTYSRETIESISLVETQDLREVLPPAFSDFHIRLMLNRRDQFARASIRGISIP